LGIVWVTGSTLAACEGQLNQGSLDRKRVAAPNV
jgi:hypothetical protein